ncbi:sensor histidine kinase [Catalinimonas niigatensis]|uniref:sensor histidine kinase n=1 Tax=Catalinimonas niigatensis TaxID=1397264 RepID=UPI002665D2E5|nr:PAS domain-containing sensor histidine kinase [Catalinimonas niigatensis]WPP53158.1 ATP-binding protein [Catalinimonas niigatensis]
MNSPSHQAQQDWKAFIDHFPDHIANFDRDYKHLYINQAIENEISLPASAVLGKSNRDLGIPGDEKELDAIEATIDSVFELQEPIDHYTHHQFEDGVRYYFMKFIPQINSSGKVESVWAMTREITLLRHTQEKLKISQQDLEKKNQELDRANATQQTLLYTIAHDLRSPLENVKALVQLINESKGDQTTVLTQLLQTATQRLDEVLSGLIDLMKTQHEGQSKQQYKLNEMLALIKTEFGDSLRHAKATITADFSACPEIKFPKAYLESLFRNIISNAIKYRSEGSPLHLEIRSECKKGFVVINFKDNGQGMDLSLHGKNLFHPFFRIDQKEQGKGIGLHIVKRILEEKGGKLEVESKLGQGTQFICWLREEEA